MTGISVDRVREAAMRRTAEAAETAASRLRMAAAAERNGEQAEAAECRRLAGEHWSRSREWARAADSEGEGD